MQDVRPPCLIFWIGYLVGDFADGRQLAPRVRKLLRDIVYRRPHLDAYLEIRGESDSHEVGFITDHNGNRIGYGVVLGGSAIENLSDEPDFCRLWLEELGGPLEDAFNKTVKPGVYVSLGRLAE